MNAFELTLLASASSCRRDDWRRFSLWLPLFCLVVWILLVARPIVSSFFRLLSAQLVWGGQNGPGYLFLEALHYGSSKYAPAVLAVNVPGLLGEALVSMPLSWPESWHPADMPLEDWRALIWPLYCAPFWWLAGIGLEGLIRARKLRWPMLTLGTVLSVICLILMVALLFAGREDSGYSIVWPFWGLGFWSMLLAAFPASWIRTRRKKGAAAA